MASFIKAIDTGLRARLFLEFRDILSLESISNSVLFQPRLISPREIAERRGNPEMEFINYWRTRVSIDWERNNTPAARRGFDLPYTENSETVSRNVKAIPVKIMYSVWFWTLDKEKLNLILEKYLFWLHTDPNLNLIYLEQYPLEMDLHFTDIEDESTLEQKYEKGVYHVHTMGVEVDGWIFLSEDPISNIIYTIKVTCYDKDEVIDYEEIIVDDSNQDTEKAESLKLFSRTITS